MQIAVLAYKNTRTKEVYHDRGNLGYDDYYIPSLLLIEEPETNLHPKWQSLLAQMFAEANSMFNIQLIIETHSEYLIRKFQTLTAEGKLKSKDIKIFYLRGAGSVTANRKQLETILIEDDGSIDYEMFDGGFFDQNDNLELSLLNIRRKNFLSDLQALKESKEQNEDTISALQLKIDEYTRKADMSVYRLIVTTMFAPATKLLPESILYLTSGQYLLKNIDQNEDFSPVIIQYGRAIEHELCGIFKNIDPAKWWKFGVMQGSLEKFKFANSLLGPCSNTEYSSLLTELNALFITPRDLKIELLQDLRNERNDAAHPGLVKTKAEAEAYMSIADQFLIKWIQLKN